MLTSFTQMKLYLVRHGQAKAEKEDPARPLSEIGKLQVKKVAVILARLRLQVHEIWHSGKLRAEQTAAIIAESLSPACSLKKVEGLAPLDEPSAILDALEGMQEPLMLVGHLPHLSRLAGLLLTGNPAKEIVQFEPGTVAALEKKEAWGLKWMLAPALALPLCG